MSRELTDCPLPECWRENASAWLALLDQWETLPAKHLRHLEGKLGDCLKRIADGAPDAHVYKHYASMVKRVETWIASKPVSLPIVHVHHAKQGKVSATQEDSYREAMKDVFAKPQNVYTGLPNPLPQSYSLSWLLRPLPTKDLSHWNHSIAFTNAMEWNGYVWSNGEGI